MYNVYQIKINNIIRYIGRTKNIVQREKQHRSAYKRETKKIFYDWLRSINYSDNIILEPIYNSKNKTESKRYEMYIILHYYFNIDKNQLKQRIPNIRDGF